MTEETQQHPCPKCGGMRNCRIIFKHSERNTLQGGLLFSSSDYFVIKCLGCNEVFFLIQKNPVIEGVGEVYKIYYPTIDIVNPEKFIDVLFNKEIGNISSLYGEIIYAINNGLLQLAAAGIRTLIDRICLHLTKSEKGFAANLEELYKLKYISSNQYEQLKIAIDLGSGVIHRKYTPNLNDTVACLEVVTYVINSLFYHPPILEEIKKHTPPRKK